MESTADRIKKAMDLRNMRQADLVEKTQISKGALSSYISGRYTPKQNNIYLIAKALDVSEAWLMGADVPMERRSLNFNTTPTDCTFNAALSKIQRGENLTDEEKSAVKQELPKAIKRLPEVLDDLTKRLKGVKINVLGRVATGIPIEAITDIIDTEEIPEDLAATGEFFGLKIAGDSMMPHICDGDIVIVRQQDDAESGDIVIASINGTDATCKRLRKYRDGIELIANNPAYQPMEFTNEDILEKPVRIIGKVIELRRKF